jgi:hypothetical protein
VYRLITLFGEYTIRAIQNKPEEKHGFISLTLTQRTDFKLMDIIYSKALEGDFD